MVVRVTAGSKYMAGVYKITTSGTKDVNINRFPDEAWTIVSGGASGDDKELEKL